MFYRKIIKEEFMKDYIKVGDVVRMRENIFINPENSPQIKIGEKEVKVLLELPALQRSSSLMELTQ